MIVTLCSVYLYNYIYVFIIDQNKYTYTQPIKYKLYILFYIVNIISKYIDVYNITILLYITNIPIYMRYNIHSVY